MNDIPEGIGGAAEGALWARAAEPRAGEQDESHTHESACLNCGTELIGPHCHQCGQGAHVHRTIGGFLHDLLHGALHFEGKIWRTLPLLVWRPGRLTREYIDGRRASYVSPMALFLFSVFVMFAVFQIVGISVPAELEPPEVQTSESVTREQLEGLRAARRDMSDSSPAAFFIDRQIEARERQLAEGASGGEAAEVVLAEGGAADAKLRTSGFRTDVAFLDDAIGKWRKNPGLMAYKLQANSYKFSWLLIPISIPFVWLIFAWRRRFGAYDHAVFVTYSLSFMTLLFVVLAILGAAGATSDWLFFGATLIPLLHIYKQLKGAYALSRFSALWRTAALSGFILIILGIFVYLLLALGAVG